MEVLYPELRLRQAIVVKVCANVELFYLFKALDFVFSLPAHTIAFDHSNVQIRPEYDGVEVLESSRERPCAHKWIINVIARLNLTLIGHEERQLVVCGGRPEVRPLFQIVLRMKGFVVCAAMSCHLMPKEDLPVFLVVDDAEGGLELTQLKQILVEKQVIK